jgi:hypothetical protein
VVLTPYCTGLFVAWSRLANRLVTRHLRTSMTVGWAAVATLLAGVFAVGGRSGMTMALASAPFVGLAIWKTGHNGDDDPPPEPDDEPPPPDAAARRGVRLPAPPHRRLPAPPRRRPTGHPTVKPRPRVPAR